MAETDDPKGLLGQLHSRLPGARKKGSKQPNAKTPPDSLSRSFTPARFDRPSFASSNHSLMYGAPPEWASGWGDDGYGVWVEFTLGEVSQRLRWIGPGRFLMGSPDDEPGRYGADELGGQYNEGPQHEVRLSASYWLFDTAVTQALWSKVMGDNPSHFSGQNLPVEQVSWDDTLLFLEQINSRVDGLDLVLPTEAQWEYACRSGTITANYGGGDKDFADIACFSENSENQTHPVATKRCNAWGLHDMLGNVWEWCADDLRCYEAASAGDPVGPLAGAKRALRGGSWLSLSRNVRAANRNAGVRGNHDIGFRPARVRP